MKERLTGAIILVALIVLLVPELLTGPIRAKSAPAVFSTAASAPLRGADRAAQAEPPLHTYTLTLGAPQATDNALFAPAAQAPPQPAVSSQQGLESSPQSLPAPAVAATHADAPQVSRRSAEPESDLQIAKSAAHPSVREGHPFGSSGGWVVQLGSFASRQNADRLARSLGGRGFRMSVSSARAGSRLLWRVRAGPVSDRAGARHLAARLRALGHGGELLPIR